MPYRPKDIYKGRRKYRVGLAIGLSVLGVLLLGSIGLFYFLQQFIVYDQSGVTLELPSQRTEETSAAQATPEPTFEPVTVQIIYENTDFSQIDLGGWDTLTETRTRLVPFADATDSAKLAAAVSDAETSGLTGLVLELKTTEGQLAWSSESELAVNYGTAGSTDYTETITALHEAGLTAGAQICCCADELMATRNWTVALCGADGTVYRDEEDICWLDPYNRSVRTYLQELVGELAAMGFDEVILTGLYHPVSEAGFQYSVAVQTDPDPVTAICQLGRRLVNAAGDTGCAVSVMLDRDSLLEGTGSATGQDVSTFWRLFARLYCPCTEGDANTVRSTALQTMNGGNADIRFVPVLSSASEGTASYCIDAKS